MHMKRMKYLIMVLAGVCILCGYESFQYKKRMEIYAVALSLKPDMQKSEVLEVINNQRGAHTKISSSDGGNSLKLSAYTGFGSFCRLKITFQNDRLISAKIRGENSPNQRFADAPPDILSVSE